MSYAELRHSAYGVPQLGYGSPVGYTTHQPSNTNAGELGISRGVYETIGAPSGGTHNQSIYGADPHVSAMFNSYEPAAAWAQSGIPHSRPSSAHVLGQGTSFEALPRDQAPLRQESYHAGASELGREERDSGEGNHPSITGAALHASIVRICAEADLETMTKRSVRQQLEQEYGIDMGGRKDEISRIVETVIEEDVR